MATREENMDSWASNLNAVKSDREPVSHGDPAFVPPVNSRTAPKVSIPKTGNEKLAAAAVEVLAGLNTAVSMGLMVAMMSGTATAISAGDEMFRKQAYAALLTDPSLCERIIAMSTASGTMGLLMAYGVLFANAAPLAFAERNNMRDMFRNLKKNDSE